MTRLLIAMVMNAPFAFPDLFRTTEWKSQGTGPLNEVVMTVKCEWACIVRIAWLLVLGIS